MRRRVYAGRVDTPKSGRPPYRADAGRSLSPRAIAEQCGWRLAGTIKLLEVYGHHDIGALAEIDKAFSRNVAPLRAVE